MNRLYMYKAHILKLNVANVPFEWKSSYSVRCDKLGQNFSMWKVNMTGAWNKEKNLTPDTIFFVPRSCHDVEQFTFHIFITELKIQFTIFIHLPQKFRNVRKTRDTFAEFPDFTWYSHPALSEKEINK